MPRWGLVAIEVEIHLRFSEAIGPPAMETCNFRVHCDVRVLEPAAPLDFVPLDFVGMNSLGAQVAYVSLDLNLD